MKETNISDEMLSQFLEGSTNETDELRLLQAMEDDNLFDEDLVAIAEAAKLADTAPQQAPNLDLAKKQIAASLKSEDKREAIPTIRRSKTRMIWAIAASAALVLAVALFFLFRPDSNDQNFAQQEEKRVEEVSKEKGNNFKPGGEFATDKDDKNSRREKSSTNETENDRSESEDVQNAPITPQKVEKSYAKTQTANSLTVTKPNKDNYRVLCKNLERSLNFEWTATNVQNLHFTVTTAQGKVLAELYDKSATHYALLYSKIYPERQLKWMLKVVFEDGTTETRTGRVQIDYNHQNE